MLAHRPTGLRKPLTDLVFFTAGQHHKLGDPAAAYQVATAALAQLAAGDQGGEDRREMLKTTLRLARIRLRCRLRGDPNRAPNA